MPDHQENATTVTVQAGACIRCGKLFFLYDMPHCYAEKDRLENNSALTAPVYCARCNTVTMGEDPQALARLLGDLHDNIAALYTMERRWLNKAALLISKKRKQRRQELFAQNAYVRACLAALDQRNEERLCLCCGSDNISQLTLARFEKVLQRHPGCGGEFIRSKFTVTVPELTVKISRDGTPHPARAWGRLIREQCPEDWADFDRFLCMQHYFDLLHSRGDLPEPPGFSAESDTEAAIVAAREHGFFLDDTHERAPRESRGVQGYIGLPPDAAHADPAHPERVENHYARWQSLFADGDRLAGLLPGVLEEAAPIGDWVGGDTEDAFYALFLWPGATSPGIGALVRQNAAGTDAELVSTYPVFDGAPAELTVHGSVAWKNGREGEVNATGPEGQAISFFDCFYYKNKPLYEKESTLPFTLFGLVHAIGPAKDGGALVTEGPAYEEALGEFLKENPEKTADDFPGLTLSLRGARLLFPYLRTSEYEFRTPILSVESVTLADTSLYKLHVVLCGTEEGLPCHLYVPAYLFGLHDPQPGEDIQGVCWLAGYLATEMEIIQ